jgi:hypothetical protein
MMLRVTTINDPIYHGTVTELRVNRKIGIVSGKPEGLWSIIIEIILRFSEVVRNGSGLFNVIDFFSIGFEISWFF